MKSLLAYPSSFKVGLLQPPKIFLTVLFCFVLFCFVCVGVWGVCVCGGVWVCVCVFFFN